MYITHTIGETWRFEGTMELRLACSSLCRECQRLPTHRLVVDRTTPTWLLGIPLPNSPHSKVFGLLEIRGYIWCDVLSALVGTMLHSAIGRKADKLCSIFTLSLFGVLRNYVVRCRKARVPRARARSVALPPPSATTEAQSAPPCGFTMVEHIPFRKIGGISLKYATWPGHPQAIEFGQSARFAPSIRRVSWFRPVTWFAPLRQLGLDPETNRGIKRA